VITRITHIQPAEHDRYDMPPMVRNLAPARRTDSLDLATALTCRQEGAPLRARDRVRVLKPWLRDSLWTRTTPTATTDSNGLPIS
jgi:hypothetical protein